MVTFAYRSLLDSTIDKLVRTEMRPSGSQEPHLVITTNNDDKWLNTKDQYATQDDQGFKAKPEDETSVAERRQTDMDLYFWNWPRNDAMSASIWPWNPRARSTEENHSC